MTFENYCSDCSYKVVFALMVLLDSQENSRSLIITEVRMLALTAKWLPPVSHDPQVKSRCYKMTPKICTLMVLGIPRILLESMYSAIKCDQGFCLKVHWSIVPPWQKALWGIKSVINRLIAELGKSHNQSTENHQTLFFSTDMSVLLYFH